MEIRHAEGGKTPLFSDQLILRDALAGYSRARWPTNTTKAIAHEWGLTIDEAKGVMLGRASQTTIDKILRHRNGGWAVVLPVLGAVIGHGVDDFIQSERRKHAEIAQRHRALVRDLRALAPDRSAVATDAAADRHRQRRSLRG